MDLANTVGLYTLRVHNLWIIYNIESHSRLMLPLFQYGLVEITSS